MCGEAIAANLYQASLSLLTVRWEGKSPIKADAKVVSSSVLALDLPVMSRGVEKCQVHGMD